MTSATKSPTSHETSLKEKAVHEFRRFVILFVYLWLLFGVFVLNQGIVLRQQGVDFALQGAAVVNALVFAKVMMAFEMFDPGGWLRRSPLIAPILYETLLLTILFILVHILEKVIVGWFHGQPVLTSLPSIGGGGLAGLLSAAAMLFVALLPFFGVRNLSLVLGEGRLWSLLFEPSTGVSKTSL